MSFKAIYDLIGKCVEGKIDLETFAKEFEGLYNKSHEKLWKTLPEETADILDDINEAISFFEPNPRIRKESSSLLNEKEFMQKLQSSFEHLKKSSKKNKK